MRASKKSDLAAAWAGRGAMAAMRTYQEKYRRRCFVATPRNGFSHAQAEIKPTVAAAYAMEHAAGEVGEIAGAGLALVALHGAALAVAHHA